MDALGQLFFKAVMALDRLERYYPGVSFSNYLQLAFSKALLPPPLYEALNWFVVEDLIEKLRVVASFADDPYFPQYTVRIAAPGVDLVANGIGATPSEALVKLVGEAIERYSLSVHDGQQLRVASFGELSSALDPLSFAGPSFAQRQQLGWERWRISKDSIFHWVEGTSLISDKKILVPAQLVFKPYTYETEEPIIRLPITSGAAAALSQNEALLHGIFELIEREAFLVTYLNRLTPPKVNLKESCPILKNTILWFEQYGLALDVYALPTDAPLSVMLAIIADESGKGGAISVGARADFDPVKAAWEAILEANHTRVAIREEIESNIKLPKDRSEVISPADHARFWAPVFRIKDLGFLQGGVELSAMSQKYKIGNPEKLQELIQFLRTRGFEVVWVDLTSSPFKNSGIFAGKVVIPQLHPLFIDERHPYYGGERLYNLPVELGYLKSSHTEEELNHLPHPFP